MYAYCCFLSAPVVFFRCEKNRKDFKLIRMKIPHIQHFDFIFFPFAQDGQRGHLEGLATVYVELLDAPFNEVLSGLENARQAAWAEQSPQHRSGMCHQGHRGSSSQGSLPNSHSQPIYVPGKYSVSSRKKNIYCQRT